MSNSLYGIHAKASYGFFWKVGIVARQLAEAGKICSMKIPRISLKRIGTLYFLMNTSYSLFLQKVGAWGYDLKCDGKQNCFMYILCISNGHEGKRFVAFCANASYST